LNDQYFMFISFETTHQAIMFEDALLDDFDIELFPVPRQVSASCGIALKFNEVDFDGIRKSVWVLNHSGTKLYLYKMIEETVIIEEKFWEV